MAFLGSSCPDPRSPHQNVEQDVEVVGQPEAPEAMAPEVVGGEDIHDGQDQEEQHPCEPCEMNMGRRAGGWLF